MIRRPHPSNLPVMPTSTYRRSDPFVRESSTGTRTQQRRTIAHSAAFALALRGGEELLTRRTPTTLGVRFPGGVTKKDEEYLHGIFRGAAGVGLALLDLYAATADDRYRRLVQE